MLLLAIQIENILTVLDQLQTKAKANFGKFSSISLEFCIGYSDSMKSLYTWDAIKYFFMYSLKTKRTALVWFVFINSILAGQINSCQ